MKSRKTTGLNSLHLKTNSFALSTPFLLNQLNKVQVNTAFSETMPVDFYFLRSDSHKLIFNSTCTYSRRLGHTLGAQRHYVERHTVARLLKKLCKINNF